MIEGNGSHKNTALRHSLPVGRNDSQAIRRAGWRTFNDQLVFYGLSNLIGAFVIALALAAILAFIVNKPLVPIQWILGGGLAVTALVIGFVDYNRTRVAAADGKVERLSGPIRVYSVRRAGWYLEVAGRSFRPPFHAWQAKNGAPYHVYVAQKANRIVSLEPDGWD